MIQLASATGAGGGSVGGSGNMGANMRQTLLRTSMLVGLGALAGLTGAKPAGASDGIKLEIGGYFSSAYVAAFDNKDHNHFGEGRNVDSLKHDAEVQFAGETVLDNG